VKPLPNAKPLPVVKANFKKDLKSLKKLTPKEIDVFLARVRSANNLDTIFNNARAMDQKRYEEELQNAEEKTKKARTEQERKVALLEQQRIEKEQEIARVRAQKNAARLEDEERRFTIAKKERAIKNSKSAFSRDLATLKKLTGSERTSFLSQVRTIDNINTVFNQARALDKERYQKE
jgi:hypothetical protein